MIYASGVVSFLSNSRETNAKYTFKKKFVSMKVVGKVKMDSKDATHSAVKVTCTFWAILPRSFECKSLEDYTGKIKPFLQKHINSVVTSVEVHHLNYVSSNRMNSHPTRR